MKTNNGVVFATVGTTKFDSFVDILTQINTLNALKQQGYNSLIIQIGNGSKIPSEENCNITNMNLTFYRFKNSIDDDIMKADLVISHAGAGTCLEVLGAKKPLLVVINEDLMHNHQTELADQLSSDGYLFACTCGSLVETIINMNLQDLKILKPPEPKLLANYLDEFMNLHEKKKRKSKLA